MTIEEFTVGELMEMPDTLADKVIVEDKHIIIRDQYQYEIPLDECTTAEELLDWTMHLCEKGWVSPAIIHRVVKVACKENNLKFYR